MLQKTALIECWYAWTKLTLPNAPGLRVAGVVHLLAVLDAVARVEELRLRRVLPGVERGGRGHGLEGRARRVETLRRTVQQRGREPGHALGEWMIPAKPFGDSIRFGS